MQCSLDRLIAPSFYKVHNSIEDYTHFWLCGGRGSTKSSFVSVEIILGIMKNADTNAVVLRKVGAYLKDSVFSQLEWAIEKLGVICPLAPSSLRTPDPAANIARPQASR